MQTRIIQHAEDLLSTLDQSFSRKQAQTIALILKNEIADIIKTNQALIKQLQEQAAATQLAEQRAETIEQQQKKLIVTTQKQSKIIVEYQTFIKTNIPIILERAESVKNDVDILIVGLQTLNDHFNKILESLNDYQLKNHTINQNAQATTADLASTSQIMDAVAKDTLEFQEKLPEFQNVVAQIHEIAEKLGIIIINAGIQSAHAGSFGSSFRVITQEIAKLNTHIQGTLLPQQESFIKEKIIPTITRTTANATMGNKKLHQNIDSLQEANTLSLSVVQSLDTMIEAIRDIKSTIDSFMDNLTGIQSNMDELVNTIKGIKTIQTEIFDYHAPEKPTTTITTTTEATKTKPLVAKENTPTPAQVEIKKISPASWIDYKGTRILYFDFSGHSSKADEEIVLEKLHEAAQVYKTTKENNIRVISNVTDCVNTTRIFEGFKALRAAGKDRIAHSVLVGATGSRKAQAKMLGIILGKLTIVNTLEEAKEFHATHSR